MKITFFQSLRQQMMEIFHPRDFRKVPSYRRCLNQCSCTAVTPNVPNNSAIDTETITQNIPDVKVHQSNSGETLSQGSTPTADTEAVSESSSPVHSVNSNSTNQTLTKNTPTQPTTMTKSPQSYQSLTESISMIKTQQDTELSATNTDQSINPSVDAPILQHSDNQSSTANYADRDASDSTSANELDANSKQHSEPNSKQHSEPNSSQVSDQPKDAIEEEGCRLNPHTEERALMLKRILIKVFIICFLALLTMLLAPKSKAHDHLSMLSFSAGVLFPNSLDVSAQYERSTCYHSAWAVELNGYLRWWKCPDCDKVCTDSFWNYYRSCHVGLVYKPCVYRTRNQHGRLRIGASVGYDGRKVLGGILLGYEQTYCLKYGCEVFWTAKMDVHALAKSWVRPGISIGIRLPFE